VGTGFTDRLLLAELPSTRASQLAGPGANPAAAVAGRPGTQIARIRAVPGSATTMKPWGRAAACHTGA
jgi:hypothetical protein